MRRLKSGFVAPCVFALACTAPEQVPSPSACPFSTGRGFSDVTTSLGLPAHGGECLALLDFDGDDWPDALVGNTAIDGTARLALYGNLGGAGFAPPKVIFEIAEGVLSCAAGDFDGDGLDDLVVGYFGGGVSLLRNTGAPSFEDASDRLPPLELKDFLQLSNGFFDYDNDGDLDLLIGRFVGAVLPSQPDCVITDEEYFCGSSTPLMSAEPILLRNDGEEFELSPGSFAEPWPQSTQGLAFLDWDGDGWLDVLAANDWGKNALFRNVAGTGSFENIAAAEGLDADNHGMGLGIGDFDANGQQEVYVADLGPDRIYYRSPVGTMIDRGRYLGLIAPTRYTSSWSPQVADFDNDGDLDIYVVTSGVVGNEEDMMRLQLNSPLKELVEQHDLILWNEASRFAIEPLHHRPGSQPYIVYGTSAAADFDRDGDLDILAASSVPSQLRLLRNDLSQGNSLQLRLQHPSRSLDGTIVSLIVDDEILQSRLLAHAHGGLGSSSRVLHFGLCERVRVDAIEVSMLDGSVVRHEGPFEANQQVQIDL